MSGLHAALIAMQLLTTPPSGGLPRPQATRRDWIPAVADEFQQARETARSAVLSNLSPDHRARVEAILDRFRRGLVSTPAAAHDIDEVLSPEETRAVMNQERRFRDAMRQTYFNLNPGSNAPPPDPFSDQSEAEDAGRFVLMVTALPPQ
jgi:hypothetical protein